jgi:tRNA(fMet)-specific endonuclease VapC
MLQKIYMESFGTIKAKLQTSGRTIADMDLIIASTVINWNYRLVTNNMKHFQNIAGLLLENWNC